MRLKVIEVQADQESKINERVCSKSNYEEEIVGWSLPFLWKVVGVALCLFENDNSDILK